jgi:hypothetical protein
MVRCVCVCACVRVCVCVSVSVRVLCCATQVDVERPDKDLYPLFEEAPYWEDELRPGEM